MVVFNVLKRGQSKKSRRGARLRQKSSGSQKPSGKPPRKPKLKSGGLQEAMLWEKERNGIRCSLCARRCFVAKDKRGFCNVRVNLDNKLYTLNYGKLIAVNVDPVEKKPLFHFYPASTSLSIAAQGCNFRCQFCDNWEISQSVDGESMKIAGEAYTPEDIVKLAEKNGCKSISYTYTEPTIFFEFACKTAKLAHRSNIMNTFVTNGYMTDEAVKKISKFLDAATVDLKASADPAFYKSFMSVPDVEPIFHCLRRLKKQRVHIEITNLIVPQIGDDAEKCGKLAERVNTELSANVPFHVLQFHPSYKMLELPLTPVSVLEKCVREAKVAGLRYVYLGNVLGHADESTYCYNCGELLIKRTGFVVEKINMVNECCPNCGFKISVLMD